jgi:hypothetical protein
MHEHHVWRRHRSQVFLGPEKKWHSTPALLALMAEFAAEKNRRQMTAVRSGLQKRIGHGAGKRQPFNPLLGWLVLIDATGEQETAPTASPLHLTRDVDTRATPMSHARNVRPFL